MPNTMKSRSNKFDIDRSVRLWLGKNKIEADEEEIERLTEMTRFVIHGFLHFIMGALRNGD